MSQLLSRHGEPDTHWRFGAVLSQLDADDGVIESLYVCDHLLVCLGGLENSQLLWRQNTFARSLERHWSDSLAWRLFKYKSVLCQRFTIERPRLMV